MSNDFRRAPSHRKKEALPTNAEMAAMLRAGESLPDMAARLGCSVSRLRARLNDAGWGYDGQPNHRTHSPRVLLPVLDDREWIDAALCAQVDGELFYPEKGGSSHAAKAVCRRCPVQTPCLEDALATEGFEAWGIRGGLSDRERRKLKRKAS